MWFTGEVSQKVCVMVVEGSGAVLKEWLCIPNPCTWILDTSQELLCRDLDAILT